MEEEELDLDQLDQLDQDAIPIDPEDVQMLVEESPERQAEREFEEEQKKRDWEMKLMKILLMVIIGMSALSVILQLAAITMP